MTGYEQEISVIHDNEAEKLEALGLFRRAAARWAEVMMMVKTDSEREEAAKRRAKCIRDSARSSVKVVQFGELKMAVNRTHTRMGLDQPNGSAFRNQQR